MRGRFRTSPASYCPKIEAQSCASQRTSALNLLREAWPFPVCIVLLQPGACGCGRPTSGGLQSCLPGCSAQGFLLFSDKKETIRPLTFTVPSKPAAPGASSWEESPPCDAPECASLVSFPILFSIMVIRSIWLNPHREPGPALRAPASCEHGACVCRSPFLGCFPAGSLGPGLCWD